jgi:GNAT superfamily N-acetyltransferase
VIANKAQLLSQFDAEVRRDIVAEPGIRVERTARVVRIAGLWNCILYAELSAESADAEIKLQQEHFRALRLQFEWKVYAHDSPADLETRLQRAGFGPQEQETFLIYDLDAGIPGGDTPPGIDIRRIDNSAGLADLARVGEHAFGVDYSAFSDAFLARLPLNTVDFYVAYKDTEPVSAARLEMPPNATFAGLYGGGTVPAYRRKGIYRALVAIRAQAALRRGYRFLNVDAAAASLPILERLGFVPLSTTRSWLWTPT